MKRLYMKKCCILILTACLVIIAIKFPLYAGINPAAFLDIGVGARALGMGGAFVSVSDDATASYWNPAGLGLIDNIQSSLMLQKLADAKWPGIEDIAPSHQFFNIVFPLNKTKLLDKGSLGLSVVLFKINDIPHTYIDSNGDLYRGSFNDTESAYYFSFGYPVYKKELLLGGSIKLISQSFSGIQGASAFGWDVDAGMLLLLTPRLNLGFLLSKGAELKWESGYVDKDSPNSKIGISYNYGFMKKMNILGACDFIQKKNVPLMASLGFELSFLPEYSKDKNRLGKASLRAGVEKLTVENRHGYLRELNSDINWNAGGGMKIGVYGFDIQLDYSFNFQKIGSKHIVSIILGKQ